MQMGSPMASMTRETVKFSIEPNQRVASAPAELTLRARYDVPTERGELCIIAEGPEYHYSCWTANGYGPPMQVRMFRLYAPGEYLVWLQAEHHRTAAIPVIIN